MDFSAKSTNQAPSTARILQLHLKGIERGNERSLAELGELLALTVRAADEGGVLPQRSHRAQAALIESIRCAHEAQGKLYDFHSECRRIIAKLPIQELGWGDGGPSPGIEADETTTAPERTAVPL